MPTSKKKKTAAKPSKKKETTAKAKKPTAKQAPKAAPTQEQAPRESFARTLFLQMMPPILFLLAILLLICLLSPSHMGLFGTIMQQGLFGLLGGGGYLVPILLAVIALFFRQDTEKKTAGLKFVYAPGICLLTSVLLQFWAYPGNPHTFDVQTMWKNGLSLIGGGVLGGLPGEAIYVIFGSWGTPIVALAGIVILTLLLFNLTPYTIRTVIATHLRAQREEMERKEALARERAELAEKKRYKMRRIVPPAPPKVRLNPVRQPAISRNRRPIQVPIDMPDPMPEPLPEDEELSFESEAPAPQPPVYGDIPISIYGQHPAPAPVAEAPAPLPEEEDAPSDQAADRAPWEEAGEGERLSPLRIRKKSEAEVGLAADPADTRVISDDVMALFKEQQQLRPEGGEVNENGMITEIEIGDTTASEEDSEFMLAIRRLSAMEGILPAENRIEEVEVAPYELPPIDLLREGESDPAKDVSEELNLNATRLVETLRSFRVRTRIVAISRGPAITRYELAPEEGVRVRAIANLVDDIALNLATTGVRIEAPIPGKSAVGVEVPNQQVELVTLRNLIESPKFQTSSSLTMVSLGMDVAGAPIYLDIFKMPHLLIAGTTGSGKSVCINCMLVSLLYHAKPDQVKLILIDPKKVELNVYNGLPHLLVPVVSDPKKAAGALHWAVTEMERRFELIEAAGVRNLKQYNAAIENDPACEILPQIVIVIDELADLMMTSRDEVETSICRLAQKARAAGMHLIIGTQRPSVDVVTGVIKANIPSRIAFKVAGQMDSRVILDTVGAEKLIGNGDMLYAPIGCTKPLRVQGAYVSSEEVDAIVNFIKGQSRASYDASVINSIDEAAERCGNKRGAADDEFGSGSDEPLTEGDPMMKKAIELAVESGKISTSLIQRRLSLGYGRAAKLIDRMETMGIVGPPEGQKPRQVLITREQYLEMIAGGFGDDFS